MTILQSSISPDGRYGVEVPKTWEDYKEGVSQNRVVEVATGRSVVLINAETGLEAMNFGGLSARWSSDSSLLLWKVEGKWFPRALVAIKLDDGKASWQKDLLKAAQQEILTRSRNADPAAYAAAKKHNSGTMGSAYPEGFTVNVEAGGEGSGRVAFPLPVKADLTANPKAIESFPVEAELNTEMDGVLDAGGAFTVSDFRLVKPE